MPSNYHVFSTNKLKSCFFWTSKRATSCKNTLAILRVQCILEKQNNNFTTYISKPFKGTVILKHMANVSTTVSEMKILICHVSSKFVFEYSEIFQLHCSPKLRVEKNLIFSNLEKVDFILTFRFNQNMQDLSA